MVWREVNYRKVAASKENTCLFLGVDSIPFTLNTIAEISVDPQNM